MRIYSNTKLSWPFLLHISQTARLYPGRWQNYYFYRVQFRYPTIVLQTYSPLELLQENNYFYCYDRYNRDPRLEKYGNKLELACTHNNTDSFNENYIYVPKPLAINDILVVKNNNITGYPSIYAPKLFTTPEYFPLA